MSESILKKQSFNVAFLGCGFAAELHSKTLAKSGDHIYRYYASRSAEKAAAFNKRFKGSGTFDSYQAAIDSPETDVVLVLTPPSSHLELTLAALSAGKHVIVEKPPFLKSSDFDIVEAAANKAGKQVFVAENYYYKPLLKSLREIIRRQLIGEILFVHINATKKQPTADWRDQPALSGGGALFEGGIHWINFIANMGMNICRIEGFRPGSPADGPEKSILAAFKYQEGPVGTLSYSWEVPSMFKGLRISRIFGKEGSITFETNGVFLFLKGRRKKLRFPQLTDLTGYKGMFDDFFQALQNNTAPEFTLKMARKDLELIEEIYRSVGSEK